MMFADFGELAVPGPGVAPVDPVLRRHANGMPSYGTEARLAPALPSNFGAVNFGYVQENGGGGGSSSGGSGSTTVVMTAPQSTTTSRGSTTTMTLSTRSTSPTVLPTTMVPRTLNPSSIITKAPQQPASIPIAPTMPNDSFVFPDISPPPGTASKIGTAAGGANGSSKTPYIIGGIALAAAALGGFLWWRSR